MMPPTAGRRIRRRRNNIQNGIVSIICLSIFAILSGVAVTAFTPTTAIGNKINVESPAHAHSHIGQQQKLYSQQSPSRTNSLVLASTNGAQIDGSAVNGGSSSTLFSSSSFKSAAPNISKLGATLSKIGMMAFIVSMCLTLPVALFPPHLLHRLNLISRVKQQNMALASGQFCARWLLRLIPFCKVSCTSTPEDEKDPQPCVWVCNHTSALDIFILLANDNKLRGKKETTPQDRLLEGPGRQHHHEIIVHTMRIHSRGNGCQRCRRS
mmetsp:Transcript_19473/g.40061  ORF Transcript_19473/g.40061 Transcript_19473/m.40061 type:complete len:267 (+) Transcript_19473:316-1116(+)